MVSFSKVIISLEFELSLQEEWPTSRLTMSLSDASFILDSIQTCCLPLSIVCML